MGSMGSYMINIPETSRRSSHLVGKIEMSPKNIFSNDIYTSNVRISITSCSSSLQNKYVDLRQQNDHFLK